MQPKIIYTKKNETNIQKKEVFLYLLDYSRCFRWHYIQILFLYLSRFNLSIARLNCSMTRFIGGEEEEVQANNLENRTILCLL